MTKETKKKTIEEQLQYWRSVELGAQLSVEQFSRRAAELDANIEALKRKRAQLDTDLQNAPALAIRARGEIRKLERVKLAAEIGGWNTKRSTVNSIERKRERAKKRVERLRNLRRKIADLQKQLAQSEGGAA